MRTCILLLLCLSFLFGAGTAQAVINQHFDQDGRLITARNKSITSALHKSKKHPVPDGAELRTDVQYEFYPVFGKTFAEIVKSAEDNGPRNTKMRKRQPSVFSWNLSWTYDFAFSLEQDEDNDAVHCDLMITDPLISYDITVTLPALTDDSALNPIEKELWKNYFVKRLNFEHGHVKIIKDDTREVLLQKFGEIAYLPLSVAEADNAAKLLERFISTETEKIGRDIITQIQRKLEAYDSEWGQNTGETPKLPDKR